MKPKTNSDVLKLMEEFLTPVRMEKRAAEDAAAIKSDSGVPQTEEEKKVGNQKDEKQKDVEKGLQGQAVAAASDAAAVKEGDGKNYADTAGTQKVDASQPVSQETVKVNESDDPSKDNSINDKQAFVRNSILASHILSLVNAGKQPIQKAAAVQQAPAAGNQLVKEAAEQAHADFVEGFSRGVQQRQLDESELMKSGFTYDQADALLNKVAEQNPEAVLPPEAIDPAAAEAMLAGGPEAGGPIAPEAAAAAPAAGMNPENEAQLTQLAQALESAGVTPEDLAEAAKTVEELQAAGVQPEEIVQAVQQIADEGGAKGAGPEAAPAVPAEEPKQEEPKPEEKAAARVSLVKNYLRALAQNK